MWTYLIGPLFSFLPQRWRKALPFYRLVKWERAAAIGGLAQFVLAFMALMHWFFHAMSDWVGRAVDAAINGKLGSAVTDQAIGGVVLFLWVVNPITLLLVYFATEGIVRLWAGEMSETVLGTLPLFLIDKIFVTVFRIGIPENRNVADSSLHNPSLARILRERLLVARLPEVGDELRFKKSDSEEILEIQSSRKKEGWSSPNVVCYRDTYYRLEADFLAGAPRPFHYVLRRLPMGVPSRKVLKYSPADAIVREQG